MKKPSTRNGGAAAKLIRNAHLLNAVQGRDYESLRRYFTHYWSSALSAEFFEGFCPSV